MSTHTFHVSIKEPGEVAGSWHIHEADTAPDAARAVLRGERPAVGSLVIVASGFDQAPWLYQAYLDVTGEQTVDHGLVACEVTTAA